ncbi:YbaB/EbfC family nucleoid-associated protein [Mycobacteroides abscessus]|uniref:YbaB/EbfC family nucleoid-associated protein n=1 Tax=Mycobacteroides abscessus TaxID=36809 RepID=UPI0002585BA9|nr:YbaB/EbfC family nucleoid-associated protein [Mycobacteroides abscessus]AMU73864.1 hypothetical protein A3O06_03665 [Mycobacteroides abscessus]ANO22801.1 hypothetical protein BAB79_03665 [Mycobacteroides abscessus]EIC62610.1 hypothetical protein OUW_21894 [Mycobacteroides abscessus M93]MDM2349377.1 YbaB/EbfC family nucleoid-associated protein [Mycobacteroides abscessus]MDM2360261.1 YbaB/EbfC family nucleoid-associated protein [Mycobacteroides abscessus]
MSFQGSADGFDIEGMLADLQEFQESVARSTQGMALETADAWSRDEMTHVWVNAQGIVVQVEFDEDLFRSARPSEIAQSIVDASQAAASAVRERVQRFQSDLWKQVADLGGSAIGPLTDIEELRSVQPDVPLSPPGSRERERLAEELTHTSTTDAANEDWDITITDQRG